MQNANKTILYSTDSTFFKDFVKNSRVFHKIQVYFQTLNFQNEIQEFFQDSRVRGNPVVCKVYLMKHLCNSMFWLVLGQESIPLMSKFVCQVGCPCSSLAQYICFSKVEIYQHVIDLFPLVLTSGSTKVVHV